MEIPEKVRERLDELNRERKLKLTVKRINGGFYLYEERSEWDKALKKVRTYTLYMGKIEDDGKYVEPHRKKRLEGIKNLDNYIRQQTVEHRMAEKEEVYRKDKEILNILGSDGRATLGKIAEKVGMTPQGVAKRLKVLEKKLGLFYTAILYPEKLGVANCYFVMAKFYGVQPTRDELINFFEKDPHVQLVFLGRGNCDLGIYALFDNAYEFNKWVYRVQISDTFMKYRGKFEAIYVSGTTLRIRDIFFTDFVEKRVWKRTKEQPRIKESQISRSEYAVVRSLSKNSRVHFDEIDKEYGLAKGSSRKALDKLIERGSIYSISASMKNPQIKYVAIIRLVIEDIRDFENRRKNFLLYLSTYNRWTNRFFMINESGNEMIFWTAIYDDELGSTESALMKLTGSKNISTTIVTDILIGEVINRRIDYRNMYRYKLLLKHYNMSAGEIQTFVERESID